MAPAINAQVAARLEEIAALLHAQGANPYRVEAYRRAALTVRGLEQPVDQVLRDEGLEGLEGLAGIGESLARSIRDLVTQGRLAMLDRLRGAGDPVSVLASVPGIGPGLADRLHHDLGIGTLEDLEAAAHDGRLGEIAGFGPKRIAGIRDSLAARLGRLGPRGPDGVRPPPVAELLDVDREYRSRASAGALKLIAPRRFNPTHEAWLPVMHAGRGDRHYTALFSNTARAHRLGRTRDWVVLYQDGGRSERQYTVITARVGPLEGRRVVRGREAECEQYYRARPQAEPSGGPPGRSRGRGLGASRSRVA
jgi:hypothetical protein